MTTKTAICNLALTLMGAAPSLTNVDQDTSVHASKLRAVYDITRDAALRAHAWNFATVRTTLAASTAAPEWGYARKYELPSEYLGQLRFDTDHHASKRPNHRVMTDRTTGGKWIHTDEGDPIYVEFVILPVSEADYDPMFVEFLAARLAAATGYSITSKATIAEEMRQYAQDLARDARWADAVDTGRDEPDEGDFLASRR